MKPCQSARATTTTRLTVSVDAEPHPMLEHFATNLLLSLLGELAADGIHATNIAVTINCHDPVHPWVP